MEKYAKETRYEVPYSEFNEFTLNSMELKAKVEELLNLESVLFIKERIENSIEKDFLTLNLVSFKEFKKTLNEIQNLVDFYSSCVDHIYY